GPSSLPLHDALPLWAPRGSATAGPCTSSLLSAASEIKRAGLASRAIRLSAANACFLLTPSLYRAEAVTSTLARGGGARRACPGPDRKSTRLNSSHVQ